MNKYPKKAIIFFLLFLILFIFFDTSNLDNTSYQIFCNFIKKISTATICAVYYDLPFWEAMVAAGTLSAAYYAYAGIRESNKRLELEQEPYVVFSDRISTSGFDQDVLHTISIKNTGKGRAISITATSDRKGKIFIIEGTNPHSLNLGAGDHANGWAIDEVQVIKGMKEQGFNGRNVMESLPEESTLEDDRKYLSDLYLYLWYEDQLGNKYMTTGKFRHSKYFIKLMENQVKKL